MDVYIYLKAEEKHKSNYGKMRLGDMAAMNLGAIYYQEVKRLKWNENKLGISISKSPA